MKLYTYYRSQASFGVRIALNSRDCTAMPAFADAHPSKQPDAE
jgi:hypothetical protein